MNIRTDVVAAVRSTAEFSWFIPTGQSIWSDSPALIATLRSKWSAL